QFECKSMIMGGSLFPFEPFPKTTYGDVSAIMIQNMPAVGRPFFTPDFKTALLHDWEVKLEKLAQIGANEPEMVMIGGVPTWTVVLFRRILELTGKHNMLEVWPKFQGYIHGGVSFTPYRKQFEAFFPSDEISYQEIYNASEGYFAAQDDFSRDDMLLLLNNGVYYEFLPMSEWHKPNPIAVPLHEVQVGKNYALVITTNAGLWRYTPGDTVTFTSTTPYRIKITGRTKQFVNAFGEEVMVENTDQALHVACQQTGAIVSEYTVAPVYFEGNSKGGHQWLVEFEKEPADESKFVRLLDLALQSANSDYEAKRSKNLALEELQLHTLPPGTFHDWMRSKGKFGGQHKVPRLANHRKYVEEILNYLGNKV
ncbi:MAG: GH3 auxin-responsive promoter family protein, partial [Phaeodactylibacter sp.]|nr:GH3 auxin-responsive promoter family protein [Phaeodactylibacter sp.]